MATALEPLLPTTASDDPDPSTRGGYPASVQPGIPRLSPTPAGWRRTPLGAHLHEIRRPVTLEADHPYTLVTVKRSRGGVEKREVLRGSEIKTPSQYLVREGDFLISKRQIVHGACGLVPADLDGALVSNEYAVLGTDGEIDRGFLRYLSEAIYFQQTCFHSSIGVHVEKMVFRTEHWLRWPFNIPPIVEQQRIAQILSSWDSSIELANAYMAKTVALRDGLIGLLVTGKRRLPGHNKPWKTQRISAMGDIATGGTPDTSEPKNWGGDILWATPSDIARVRGRYIHLTERRITEQGLRQSAARALPPGSLLVCTRATICELAIAATIITTNQGFKSIVPTKKFDVEFLFYLFRHNKSKFVRLACGSTFLELGKRDFARMEFSVPDREEQTEIAKRINAIDDQIGAMRVSIECLRSQKRQLMQDLLTGRRRLSQTKLDAELVK